MQKIQLLSLGLVLTVATTLAMAPVFVSTSDANDLINGGSDVKVLDCTVSDTDAVLSFHQSHVPGAQFIDLRYFRNQSSPYNFMLTSQDQFTDQMKLLNIKKSTRVILYDTASNYYATRIYWMLRVFGHENASVIDGGFKKWLAENRSVESTPGYGAESDYDYQFIPALYRSFEQILDLEVAIKTNATTEQISDARPKAQYDAGHIEGALNVWWKTLQNDDGTVKTPAEIWEIAGSNGVNLTNVITTSCQSGITATWLYASFQHAGSNDTAVYDGSWSEYSDRKNKTPHSSSSLSSLFFLY